MKIERTDIYARIHKGLRKALFEFSEQAGRTDPENLSETTALTELGNKVFAFLELHAEIEERFQLPLLDARDPDYAKQDHNEHMLLERIIGCLKGELSQLKEPGTTPGKGYRFYLHLNEFIGQYLLHMHHEEATTAEFFIHHCSPEEMFGVIEGINAYTTSEQKELALQYFIPAMTLPERIQFLEGVKASNRKAYEQVLRQTEKALTRHEFALLRTQMQSNIPS